MKRNKSSSEITHSWLREISRSIPRESKVGVLVEEY